MLAIYLDDFKSEPTDTECYAATWSSGGDCRKCGHECYHAGWTKKRVIADNKRLVRLKAEKGDVK